MTHWSSEMNKRGEFTENTLRVRVAIFKCLKTWEGLPFSFFFGGGLQKLRECQEFGRQ